MKTLLAGLLVLAAGTAFAQGVIVNGNGVSISSTSSTSFSIHSGSGAFESVDAKGPVQMEERHLDTFTSVEISVPLEMNYYVSGTPGFKISAPADALPYIITQVEDGRLVIKIRDNTSLSLHDAIRVDATGPSVEAVSLSGSGQFNAANLAGQKFDAVVDGSGSVTVSGEVEEVKVDISGSGNVDTTGIHAKKVSAMVSGSGNARVFASREIDSDVSGAGMVTVSGAPRIRNSENSGAGRTVFLGKTQANDK